MNFLDNELKLLQSFTAEFDKAAEQQSTKLMEAHERFSSLMDGKRFQVVHPGIAHVFARSVRTITIVNIII